MSRARGKSGATRPEAHTVRRPQQRLATAKTDRSTAQSGDTVSSVDESGARGRAIASGMAGLHAVTISGRALGVARYAASWSTGQLLQIDPTGNVTNLASVLRLTNYDGNILAASFDILHEAGDTQTIRSRPHLRAPLARMRVELEEGNVEYVGPAPCLKEDHGNLS